jgi:hypothetical protein
MCTRIHSHTANNSQKVAMPEYPQMNKLITKQIVVTAHNGILSSSKNEGLQHGWVLKI